MKDFEIKVLSFISALGSAYKEYEEREDFPKVELPTDNMTEDFTAMLIAQSILYEQITGDDTDLIGFTHILNRLALQYIMNIDEKDIENATDDVLGNKG